MFAGAVIDRAPNVRIPLIIGLAIELIILVVFGTASAFFVALVANFAMNLGFSFVEATVNVMPTLTTSKRSAHSVMNLVHMAFSVGAEVAVSSWVVYYLQKQLGLSAVASASGLSILWLFIMVGRYINSVLGNRYSSLALVTASSVGGAIGVIAFLFARSIVPAYILLGWIGLCLAGGFPNVMAELNNRDPEKTGAVTAVMAIGAAVGAGIFQWFVGYLAETVSLTAAFVTPAILQLLVIVSFAGALGPGAWRRKHPR